ncbi:hypothetical protein N9937_02110, partial [bacterium]|nr:hypothetical protein [bacterium]
QYDEWWDTYPDGTPQGVRTKADGRGVGIVTKKGTRSAEQRERSTGPATSAPVSSAPVSPDQAIADLRSQEIQQMADAQQQSLAYLQQGKNQARMDLSPKTLQPILDSLQAGNTIGADYINRGYDQGTQQLTQAETDTLANLQGGFSEGRFAQNTGANQGLDAIMAGGSGALSAIQGGMGNAISALNPQMTAGRYGLGAFSDSALNPNSAALNMRLDNQATAINRQLAARGLLNSGAGIQAQSDAAKQIIADESERQVGRQAQLAQLGIPAFGQAADYANRGALAQAGIYSGLGGQVAGIQGARGQSLADLAVQEGTARGSVISGTGANLFNALVNRGTNLGGLAERTGTRGADVMSNRQNSLANTAIGTATTGANLSATLGQGLANTYGAQATDIMNQQAAANAQSAAKKNSIMSGVLGLAGTAIGTYFGGPVGAAAGGAVGNKIGQNIG